jgi:hypothetical protein
VLILWKLRRQIRDKYKRRVMSKSEATQQTASKSIGTSSSRRGMCTSGWTQSNLSTYALS